MYVSNLIKKSFNMKIIPLMWRGPIYASRAAKTVISIGEWLCDLSKENFIAETVIECYNFHDVACN